MDYANNACNSKTAFQGHRLQHIVHGYVYAYSALLSSTVGLGKFTNCMPHTSHIISTSRALHCMAETQRPSWLEDSNDGR